MVYPFFGPEDPILVLLRDQIENGCLSCLTFSRRLMVLESGRSPVDIFQKEISISEWNFKAEAKKLYSPLKLTAQLWFNRPRRKLDMILCNEGYFTQKPDVKYHRLRFGMVLVCAWLFYQGLAVSLEEELPAESGLQTTVVLATKGPLLGICSEIPVETSVEFMEQRLWKIDISL